MSHEVNAHLLPSCSMDTVRPTVASERQWCPLPGWLDHGVIVMILPALPVSGLLCESNGKIGPAG